MLFLVYVGFVLYRIGFNFFYESVLSTGTRFSRPIFYLPAAVFLFLWTGLLVILFTRRLRRGLDRRIDELAADLIERQLGDGLYPELQQVCEQSRMRRERLEQLIERTDDLRRSLAAPALLGTPRPGQSPHTPSPHPVTDAPRPS